MKIAITPRITPKAKELLIALKDCLGISQVAALEIAIREAAQRRGISSKTTKASS